MNNFKFIKDVKFLGLLDDQLKFKIAFNGHWFDYFQGTGHAKKFSVKDLAEIRSNTHKKLYRVDSEKLTVFNEFDFLYCIKLDAECGFQSFSEFCDNMSYSNDSLKALDIYRACEDTAKKVRGFAWPIELEDY